MAELKTAEAPDWSKFITDFDATNKMFNDNYQGLIAQGPYVVTRHPELMGEYDRMVAQAKSHKVTLDKLGRIKNTVSGWLSSIGAFFTTSGPTDPGSSWGWGGGAWGGGSGFGALEEDGLGIIPAVIWGVAAATAALAVIGKWIKDAYFFSRRLNELRRLEDSGLSPQAAAAVVDKAAGKVVGFLGLDFKWIVIGGVLLVFGPLIFRMLKGRS